MRFAKAASQFKSAILSYIVSQMSTQKDVEELQKTFKSLDKDNNGELCRGTSLWQASSAEKNSSRGI